MLPDLVYDIGMNNGDDTAYYLRRGCRVVAVEAHPLLAAEAARRFAREVSRGSLTILNVGISEVEGEVDFWLNEQSPEWSSFFPEVAGRAGHALRPVKVRCVRLGEIFRGHGVPFYLKIDIEGKDEVCLEDLDAADAPEYLSLESFSGATILRLRDLGYGGFKCIDQASFCPVTSPPDPDYVAFWRVEQFLAGRGLGQKIFRRLVGPALRRAVAGRRRLPGWTFPKGSSGAFAEETAGEWQTCERILEIYQDLRERAGSADGKGAKETLAWSDLHARRRPGVK